MKKIALIVLPLAIALVLSGCGGRSLSDYTIVQGVGIDSSKNKTIVSLQYLNLAKSTGATDSLAGNITTVTHGESVNISDAIFSASIVLSQEIFFGQNKIIVFGSQYVRDDISTGLDYLLRSVDSRPDVVVAVSDSTASEIIKSGQQDARVPAESIYDLLSTGEKNGLGAIVTVNDLLRLYSSETSDIYMPVLKANKDNVACIGIAVFSNEKFALSLDKDKSLAFLIIKNKVEDASIVVNDDKLGNIGAELTSSGCKRYVTVDNGIITFHCDVKVEIILDDVQKGVTASVDQKLINGIEKLVQAKLKRNCYSLLNSCANAKSDPLEIGKYLDMYDDDLYKDYKSNWRDRLADIQYDVKVNVELTKINDSSVK